MPGTTTLAAEVTHVSKHGFWLLLGREELLVAFEQFPWFRKGTIGTDFGCSVADPRSPLLAWVGH